MRACNSHHKVNRIPRLGRTLLAATFAGLISACGGGGGGSGASPEALPSPTPSASPSTTSTAMADNPAPRSFSFAQYSRERLTLDLSAMAPNMSGSYYVVKVDDGQGETFYLGAVDRLQVVQIPIAVPNTLHSVWVELFTDEPQAGTVRQEIAL